MHPKLREIRDRWDAVPVGPWKWAGHNLENSHGDTILQVSAQGDHGYDATVHLDFGYGVEDFLARARGDMSDIVDLVEAIDDDRQEECNRHDHDECEWDRERENLDYKIKQLREALLLVFRDTHSAGTMHFNRDTVSCYTAEQVRKTLGIDQKWIDRDNQYERDRAAASDSGLDEKDKQ